MVCRMVGSCRVPAVELVGRYANSITLTQLEDYVSRDTHREMIEVLCQGLSTVSIGILDLCQDSWHTKSSALYEPQLPPGRSQ